MKLDSSSKLKAALPVEGWRGHVTLLFADLCDFTALSEVSDPEETDLLRRQLEEAALGVIQRHGGAVNQFYGDGILAVFGFPTAREDDAKRAIYAALELREAASKIQPRLGSADFEIRMHMGIHSGLVFARAGDALHGKYDLTGDAVNTTARLCHAAEPNEILVSEVALRGNEAFFADHAQVELSLKGKRAPVVAHKVTARSSVQSRFEARTRRGLTDFVAREAELAELERMLEVSTLGQHALAVVSGAAGIGKSRLLEEFRSRAHDRSVRTLFGCCAGSGEMVALEPFIYALRQLFGIQATTRVDDAVGAVEELLGVFGDWTENLLGPLLQLLSLPPPAASGVGMKPSVEKVLSDLVAALAARSPLVLVLDDWQWADDASRKVLNNLRRLADAPLGVIIAMREPDASDPVLEGARVLRLAPLSEEQTARMIRALRPHDLELRVAPAIHRRSGGNPLFVEELVRSLHDPQSEQMLEQSEAPSTLQGVIQSRVAALPPAYAEIVRVASVFGPELSLSLLSQVVQVEELANTLAGLVREDVIYETEHRGVFRFKHGITRDVIYETVRIAERRRIHLAIARAIEQKVNSGALADQSEALAYHYSGAGDHEGAAKYAEIAGNKAMAATALDRARFQYEATFAALDRLPLDSERMQRWVVISIKWAGACVYNPAPYQLPLLQRAGRYAKELADQSAQAQVEYWLGWIHYSLGECSEATAHFQRALEWTDAAKDSSFVAQLYANLGQSHADSGEYAEAVVALTRSIDMRRSNPRYAPGQPISQGFAYSLGSRAAAFAAIGEFDAADTDMQEALAIAKNTGHPVEGSVLALEAMLEIYRGRWERCAAAAAASTRVAERVYSASIFSISSAFLAYARFMLTHSAETLLDLRKAIQWLERHDFKLKISFTYALMAEASLEAGDLDSASDYAERALARASRSDPLGEIMAYRVLARRSSLYESNAAEVDACLKKALSAAERQGSRCEVAITQLLQGELCFKGGDSEKSRTCAASALSEFEAMKMDWYADKARKLLSSLS